MERRDIRRGRRSLKLNVSKIRDHPTRCGRRRQTRRHEIGVDTNNVRSRTDDK